MYNNILKNLTIELTNKCNSRCVHCYNDEKNSMEVSLDTVIKIIDQAYELNVFQITLTGGDPLLHSNIVEIIDYIKKKDMAINLLTSLNMYNTIPYQSLCLCDKIGVSIYGSNSKKHDSITQCYGSFERMMKNVNVLRSFGVSICFNITILKNNVSDIDNIISLVRSMGVQYRLNYNIHGKKHDQYQASSIDLCHYLHKYLKHNMQTQLDKEFKCTAASSSLWIDTNLDVFPCVFFRANLGNFLKTTLKEIWTCSDVIKLCRNFKSTNLKYCDKCKYKVACLPCIGENYNQNGDITIPADYCCKIGKINYELLKYD